MVEVEYGHGPRLARVSDDEVDGLLDRIADEARRHGRPQDVQVTVESAGTLGIVVGADWSVLNHVAADLDTPCRESRDAALRRHRELSPDVAWEEV